jgi:hypothetical protein
MSDKPYHIKDEPLTPYTRCSGTLGKVFVLSCVSSLLTPLGVEKLVRDRYGRPLTIRYTYNKVTYVANREQVHDSQNPLSGLVD